MSKHYEIARHLIPAVAYGDAAGLPFEAQPSQDMGSVTGLRDTETNPFLGKHPVGTWSDDTHLTLAVTKSLIDEQRFDLGSQAEWHIRAYRHVKGATDDPDMVPPLVTNSEQNGWGNSTTKSVERLVRGTPPRRSGEPDGAGNGVLMKISPLVAWQLGEGIKTSKAEQQCIDLTRMTHDSGIAVVTSLLHRRYLERLADGVGPVTALVAAHDEVPELEKFYKIDRAVSLLLGRLMTPGFLDQPSREALLTTRPKKRKEAYFGFYAPETLLMAYGSFILEQTAPDSIFRSVELGGDSDSVGSIVAAMNVFADKASPVAHRADYTSIFDRPRLEKISNQLAATIK